jgi:hypothetical protein
MFPLLIVLADTVLHPLNSRKTALSRLINFTSAIRKSERLFRVSRWERKNLSQEHLTQLREVFVKNAHLRFKREIDSLRHMPYGTSVVYAEGIRNASIERVAKIIKIVGTLLQTKVYLFWRKSQACP